ncbi:uncharacterized protein LOC131219212 isoform X2 [Magnolia sinica]|uniref:uncharacterized protein LOC131219212 isoform X2 n=1 Tax=Magnolia sinica TaxID=86752 RepID=UPI00265AB90D|nr:uncharacterized protein LOC131219212 isoform X2 [Magnolia sinica]
MGKSDESTNSLSALDIDIDMGLDDPAPAPKPSRFQPKFKPKLKPKGESTPAPLHSLTPKKEDVDFPPLNVPKQVKEEDVDEKKAMDVGVKAEVEEKPMMVVDAKEEQDEENAMDVDINVDTDDGDEDTVVREIDVFFTPLLDTSTQLYLMQYPFRPCWRPYEINERCQEVRVQPKQSKLEVDLEMNVDPDIYNEEVPEPLRMQKQTLTSSKAPYVTSYAVGILTGDKLYLNPIHAVVQLRSSMAYLNAGKFRKKSNVIGSSEITTKSGEGKLASEASNELKTEDIESWLPLEYHAIDSSISSRYRLNMVAEESRHLQFSMSLYNYGNSICPGTSNNIRRSKGPPRRFLLKLPLEERFKRWLSEGPHVHRFAALVHLAPENSVEDVLKVLQQHADLVQGLWVSKSSLRCEGVNALARDYILLLFSKKKFIHRDQLKALKVPSDIMKDILTSLAVERSLFSDWKFKEPEDCLFMKAHPDIVEVQKKAWSSREKNISEAIHGVGRKGTATVPRNPLNPGIGGRGAASSNIDQRAKGSLDGMQSSRTTTMSDETREALPKALLELFHVHKVCSLQLISQGLRDMAVSKSIHPKADPRVAVTAAHGANAPLPELQSVISKVAINIHGVYVLKSLGIPTIDPLRNVVINLFMGKEPNGRLKKADIVEAARIKLKREISPSEYNQVMAELCISRGGAWVLKSGDGKP